MPMEILRLDVEGEGIGEQRGQRAGDIVDGAGSEIARCAQRCGLPVDTCYRSLPLHLWAFVMEAGEIPTPS
jgi:hypothetical protein